MGPDLELVRKTTLKVN